MWKSFHHCCRGTLLGSFCKFTKSSLLSKVPERTNFRKEEGFGLGKAAAGGFLLGIPGLLGGLIGSNKILVTCLRCGHRWKAGTM